MSQVEFFIDRCLGRRVGEALREQGLTVHLHDDHFGKATSDTEWLSAVGLRGWFVITKDHRIRTNLLERDALLAAGVGAFILKSGNASAAQMIEVLSRHKAKMLTLALASQRPFIAIITSRTIALLSPRLRPGESGS